MSHNPFDGVGKLHEGRGRVRFQSDEERSDLLRETAKDQVLHTFMVLALSTTAMGIRKPDWAPVSLGEGLQGGLCSGRHRGFPVP